MFVFVVDFSGEPLMPTSPSRARRWIKEGKATPFFRKGVFCVRLNINSSALEFQEVAVGIDPGAKKEAFTIKSAAHTYLSVQTDAVTWVRDKMETRKISRKNRRKKSPCRKNKTNRKQTGLTASSFARWDLKYRISKWIRSFIPVSFFVVEDCTAGSKRGARKWNKNFSSIQKGKTLFYESLGKIAPVYTREGWETAEQRILMGLKKISNKLSDSFFSHCVDSWVLANELVGGHSKIDNFWRIILSPWNPARRQLHVRNPISGGRRKTHGSTRSLGLRRMSLVVHPKYGKALVGGTYNKRVSLSNISSKKRLSQEIRPESLVFKSYYPWNFFYLNT